MATGTADDREGGAMLLRPPDGSPAPVRSTSETPALGVVVVSYNTRVLLDRCLAALRAELCATGIDADVWVVDNASSDDSTAMLAAVHPWVTLDALRRNIGFAAANNRPIRRWIDAGASAPAFVLALNPDTEIRPGAIAALLAAMRGDPLAGVAGPSLIYPDGRFQHAAFRFPGLAQVALDLWPVPRLSESTINGRYPRRRYAAAEPFIVDVVLGACLMLRTEAVRRIGPFDEGFFMYAEELDWCRRLGNAGWHAVCAPRAVVLHHAGASTRQFRSEMFSALWRSRLRYYAKHEPPLRRLGLEALVRLGLWSRGVSDTLACRSGRLAVAERQARATAYRAVFERTAR